ncbi:MAG: cache domain-containing protein [Rhodospirillaceae bacterium]
MAAVLGFVSVLAYQDASETVDWAKRKQLSGISTMIEVFLREQKRQTTATAEQLGALPQLGELVARGDREGLLRMLMPGYQRAVTKYGVEALGIVTPPATTVVRLHEPGKFGDDQSGTRPILVFTNQTREVQSGLEISSVAGMRGVVPLYQGAVHVGALELASGLGPTLSELKTVTGAELAMVIKDEAVPAHSHLRKTEARKLKTLFVAEVTDWTYLSAALRESDVDRVNEVGFDTRTVGGIEVGVVKVPLFDFSGKNIGAVFGVKEISEFGRALKDAQVRLAVAAGIGLLVILGVSLLVVSGLLLRPLERLGKRLKTLAAGDFSTRVEAVGRRDELGALAVSIESVRVDLLRRFPPGSAPPLEPGSGGTGT